MLFVSNGTTHVRAVQMEHLSPKDLYEMASSYICAYSNHDGTKNVRKFS